jgi:type I restriction enzyme S subunit
MNLILFKKNQNKLLNLSSGSGRVRISKNNLFNRFSFELPSIEEQTKIANFLSSIDNKIEQVGKQLDESKQFKKALLQQMFV